MTVKACDVRRVKRGVRCVRGDGEGGGGRSVPARGNARRPVAAPASGTYRKPPARPGPGRSAGRTTGAGAK